MKISKCPPQSLASSGDETCVIEDTPLELLKQIIDSALEAKGSDISVLDMRGVSDISDYFLIVNGRSDRQVQGISNRIQHDLQESGTKPQFIEGYDQGHWIVMDYVDVVVHVFYGPTREKFDLDGLWVHSRKLILERDESGNESLRAA